MRVLPLVAGLGFLIAGCGDWLAKNNPCGGIYPDPGVAEVTSRQVTGTVTTEGGDGEFIFPVAPGGGPNGTSCDALLSGSASDDDTGTSTLEITCSGPGVSSLVLTLPDVRPLEQGQVASLPAKATGYDADGNACAYASTATMRVDQAAGSQAASPTFVTSDFERDLVIAFDSASGLDGGGAPAPEAGAGSCPTRVLLDAHVTLTAASYSQGMQEGPDHCPPLPSK